MFDIQASISTFYLFLVVRLAGRGDRANFLWNFGSSLQD